MVHSSLVTSVCLCVGGCFGVGVHALDLIKHSVKLESDLTMGMARMLVRQISPAGLKSQLKKNTRVNLYLSVDRSLVLYFQMQEC